MYITQEIAEKVKSQAKQRKIPIKDLLATCELNVNTISDFSRGQQISLISFARIADVLNCSVDYLLGRTDNPSIEAEGDLQRIINIYKNLNMEGRKQLLIQADILSRVDEYKKCSDSEQVG